MNRAIRSPLPACALAIVLLTGPALPAEAQAQRPAAPAQPEIKLDESTTLKAAALEARMSALVANFALLQRQAQDIQQELKQVLDERSKLIEEAARKAKVDAANPNEWAFDNKAQRYVKIKKTP
jgi:hypothetical protein